MLRKIVYSCFFSILLACSTWACGNEMSDSRVDDTNYAEPKPLPAIFGILISNLVAGGVQALFGSSTTAVQPVASPVDTYGYGSISNTAPCYASVNSPGKLSDAVRDGLARSGCQIIAGLIGNMTQRITGNATQIGVNPVQTPAGVTRPLVFDAAGNPNYQGLKIAVLIIDNNGNIIEERPIGSNFYTKEKFRLRLQSTFPGFLEILHTSPSGMTKRLFPHPEIGQFMVNSGAEVIIPLGGSVYEFFGDTGIERLTLNISDPRLTQAIQGSGQVYRQDMTGASYYAQSLSGGQLPSISQTVQILHSNR